MKTTYKLTFSVENSDKKKENLSELEKLIKKAILESYLDYQFTDFKCDKKIDLKAEKLKSEKLKAEELKARNQKIVKLRKKGFTYQYIGDKFGITRERVRCILKDAGIVHNISKAKIIASPKSSTCKNSLIGFPDPQHKTDSDLSFLASANFLINDATT